MIEPAWHPDPSGAEGHERWWDGTQWTDHVRTTPGWHPDPSGAPGMRRWWDGTQWTDHLQADPSQTAVMVTGLTATPTSTETPATAAAPTSSDAADHTAVSGGSSGGGRRLLLLAGAGALIAAVGLGVTSFVGDDEEPEDIEVAAVDPDGETSTDPSDEAATVDDPGEDETPDHSDTPTPAPSMVQADYGPGCQGSFVERDPPPQPWEIAGCDSAPIDGSEVNWMVVLSSLNDDVFTWQDALDRRDAWRDQGVTDAVAIWTDFYASLNPGLFAVLAGPYASEDEAVARANQIGQGSYAREVSADLDARYCDAADGCRGETGS